MVFVQARPKAKLRVARLTVKERQRASRQGRAGSLVLPRVDSRLQLADSDFRNWGLQLTSVSASRRPWRQAKLPVRLMRLPLVFAQALQLDLLAPVFSTPNR